MTLFDIRQRVWNFWYINSQDSTNTIDIVSLRVTYKPQIQENLIFMDSVKHTKRKCEFFQAIWITTVKTYRELFQKFCIKNPDIILSMGSFFALKPFYVHHASKKDLVMCCCKLHLHVRWAIQVLIKCLDKQSISFPAADYVEFFQLLYADCPGEDNTYISFDCTPDKRHLCEHIIANWIKVQESTSASDDKVTILFTEFKKLPCFNADGEEVKNKQGQPVKRLTPVKSHANATYLVQFLDNLLPDIIHHRNMLKLYQATIKAFNTMISSVHIDIDF